MKLYIVRQGSGWGGGYQGKYLVNLDNMSYTEIQEEEVQRDRYIDWIKKLEHHSTDLSLKDNYDCLKNVDSAESVRTPVSFDMQADVVYAINHGKVKPVYSPCSDYYISIEDESIRNKLFELIKEVSDQHEEYDNLPKLNKEHEKYRSNNLTHDTSNCFIVGEVESDEIARKFINMATMHSKM